MATTDAFNLLIRLSNGQRLEVTIEGSGDTAAITVLKVKELIAVKDSTAPAERQRLIYKGRILDNDRTLSDYGIVKGATLFMVKSATPPAPSTTTTTTTTTTSAPAPSTTPSASAPRPTAVPPMVSANSSPFAAMFGAQQQQQRQGMPGMPPPGGMPNPEQMQAMLNSPHMQGLLDNPDLLGSMLEQSMQTPQMQQLMERNPELRQLYSDPAMIQQAIQMMRNPQHMQQVMRQQDLAMSQLENMPGGFAALSNMYRNVQEPMMEAQQASRQTDTATAANGNSSGTEGATGAAMPNPWGAPAPAPRSSTNAAAGGPPPNPFAAMAGAGGAPNPWAAMAAGGGGAPGGAANPFAAMAAGNPGAAGGMPNPWGAAAGAGGMPAGMPPPNIDQMMQVLDNPVMSQMMNDMVQNNPDMIRSMLEAQNPMLRQMFQGNPDMANNFIRNMFNPQNMRNMMEMQRALGGMGAAAGAGGAPPGAMPPMFGAGGMPPMMFGMPPPGGMPGAGAAGGDLDFSNLLQQFQQTGLGAAAGAGAAGSLQAPVQPMNPADRYRVQLQSLYGMGFDDEQANLAALQANHGNLNRAVDQLLMNPPPAPAPAPATADASNNSSNNDTSGGDAPSSEGGDSTPKEEKSE